MNSFKRIYTGVLLLLSLALTGCCADIAVSAKEDSSTNISINMDIGQSVGGLIKALFGMTGSGKQVESIVSPKEITEALTQGGYINARAESSDTKLSAEAGMPPKTSSALIKNTGNSLTVYFSPQALRTEYESMSEEAKAYIDLLMAPIFTGEELSRDEYIELIKSAYGSDLANELQSSAVTLSLSQPKGKKRKSHSLYYCESQTATVQTYSIPLVDFLTFGFNEGDSESCEFSISWE